MPRVVSDRAALYDPLEGVASPRIFPHGFTDTIGKPRTANRRDILSLPAIAASTAMLAGLGAAKVAQADSLPDGPLGIGLEGWPYPGPVEFLPVLAEGQPVRMAYMDFLPTASTNGRAVFLLHGKNFDSSYWNGPISWLRDAGFRVVVPDQVGFNKSAKPDIGYSLEFLAENTMAIADKLRLEQISVLGHSTGGMLAVRMTAMYPDRIHQLILEDPIGLIDYRFYIQPQSTEKLVQTERNYTTETYRAFIAHFFHILQPADYEPFVTWRMRLTQSSEFERFARASALTYQMIYRGPVVDLYSRLQPPVLLMAGQADQSAPLVSYATQAARAAMPPIPEAAKMVVDTIPRGRLKLFANVGHVPHLEVPGDFKSTVLQFLA
ncbi:MAG: alpha/beta hydrolase [Acetobacteraceae bacterium]|nr:alpha/beta hydrolase [Acetobacteraceae bacterium]